jgi:hypothetical protein
MVKKKDAASKAVSQAELSVASIRKRTKKILKSAQLDIKQYRKQLATLKKQGVVSKRVNAARHKPTRYMVGKIKKFKGVALGHELAVPLNKLSTHRAREYVENAMAKRIGKFITVPKTSAKQKADIFKGHVRITTQLKYGEEEVILFGSRFEDMHDILNWLRENEQRVNDLKGPHGQLGFQISGFNSRVGLANVRELIAYLEQYDGTNPSYRGNLFNGDSHKIAQEFVIIRFRPNRRGPMHPTMEPYYGIKRRSKHANTRRAQSRYEHYKRENARKRKASQRLAEDKEAYENRLAKQRERDRRNANARREKRMAKKLLGDK